MSCFVSNLASTWIPLRGIWKVQGRNGDPGRRNHQGLDLGRSKKRTPTPNECPTIRIGPVRKLHIAKKQSATKHLECLNPSDLCLGLGVEEAPRTVSSARAMRLDAACDCRPKAPGV